MAISGKDDHVVHQGRCSTIERSCGQKIKKWVIKALFLGITICLLLVVYSSYYGHTPIRHGGCSHQICIASSSNSGSETAPFLVKEPSTNWPRRNTFRQHGNSVRGKKAKTLPQCLLIGFRKAGTQALIDILTTHPQVVSNRGECHFFDNDSKYKRGLDLYRAQMPFSLPGQITIERTPAYILRDKVPERVHKMNASIKLLVILREPVERAISDYLHGKESNIANKYSNIDSFEELVYDSKTKSINREIPVLHRSLYVRYIQNWLTYFPLEQFYFVDGNKIAREPQNEIAAIEDFLKLSHRIDEDNFVYNSTKGFYCLRSRPFISRKLEKPRCLSSEKGRAHPKLVSKKMKTRKSTMLWKTMFGYIYHHQQPNTAFLTSKLNSVEKMNTRSSSDLKRVSRLSDSPAGKLKRTGKQIKTKQRVIKELENASQKEERPESRLSEQSEGYQKTDFAIWDETIEKRREEMLDWQTNYDKWSSALQMRRFQAQKRVESLERARVVRLAKMGVVLDRLFTLNEKYANDESDGSQTKRRPQYLPCLSSNATVLESIAKEIETKFHVDKPEKRHPKTKKTKARKSPKASKADDVE